MNEIDDLSDTIKETFDAYERYKSYKEEEGGIENSKK